MLNGQLTVFLSCSEKAKEHVAIPIRDALADHGIYAVIVSEEPMLPRTSGEPEGKVEAYLEASDAFVALCTPDDQLKDRSFQCRQNVIDEVARARSRPKLRDRSLVFKEPTVRLPSNINPAYERLDIDDISPVPGLIARQLKAWDLLQSESAHITAAQVEPSATVTALIDNLELGDHDEAGRRAYKLLRSESRESQAETIEQIRCFLRDASSQDSDEVHRVSSILEAINRLDQALVPVELIEELATAEDHAKRMCAAMLLWDRAEIAPGHVPLGLIGRLAKPATEDWYVHAPAMAAVKQLLLHRRAARIVFDRLSASEDPENRYAVAVALLDVAQVDPIAVPRDLVQALAKDRDDLVASKARESLEIIGEPRQGERDPRSPFGL